MKNLSSPLRRERRLAVLLFKRALLLALLLHLFGLVAVPSYSVKIISKEPTIIGPVPLPPIDYPLPPKPPVKPMPPIDVADEDENIPTDMTIDETILDERVEAPTEPPPLLPESGEFVGYDTKPEPIRYITPTYPEMARKAGIEGTVMAQLLIGADGKVYDVLIVAGPEIFHASVETAARQCVFSPAKQRDKPVAVWVTVPFRFSLRNVE
jgi:protein TonB